MDKKLDGYDLIISNWATDLYEQEETQTEDVDFLLSVIGPESKRILEVACGSGRILVPLAKAGHHVTGIDIDASMLQKIEKKAEGLSNLTWKRVDAIAEPWGSGFDVVVIAGNLLFNIITEMDYAKAQQLFLEKAAQALVKGGCVYIEYGYTPYPERWFDHKEEHVIFEGTDENGNTGKMSVYNSSYHSESGMVNFTRRYEIDTPEGNRIEKEIVSSKHFATLEQLHSWLEMAGFQIEEEYGDYHNNPIGEDTGHAVIKARKL